MQAQRLPASFPFPAELYSFNSRTIRRFIVNVCKFYFGFNVADNHDAEIERASDGGQSSRIRCEKKTFEKLVKKSPTT